MSENKKEQEIVEALKAKLGQSLLTARIQRPRRIFATVSPSALTDSVRFLMASHGLRHLATITGVDLGKDIAVYYHLIGGEITVNLRVDTPKTEPKLPTIVPMIPGAELYEREVYEMFGVIFEGHPDLTHLILPDGWPENVYPMRKEWKTDAIKNEIAKALGEKLE
jgi:NADH:ubiquinone oxidoreductase subunit C